MEVFWSSDSLTWTYKSAHGLTSAYIPSIIYSISTNADPVLTMQIICMCWTVSHNFSITTLSMLIHLVETHFFRLVHIYS